MGAETRCSVVVACRRSELTSRRYPWPQGRAARGSGRRPWPPARTGWSGQSRGQLPLLVGPAVAGPLHDLRPVVRRGTVDVRHQSAVVADDGVVAVACGPQVPHLVGAAVGRPLLELQPGRAALGVDVEHLSTRDVPEGVGAVRGRGDGPGAVPLCWTALALSRWFARDSERLAAVAIDDPVGGLTRGAYRIVNRNSGKPLAVAGRLDRRTARKVGPADRHRAPWTVATGRRTAPTP